MLFRSADRARSLSVRILTFAGLTGALAAQGVVVPVAPFKGDESENLERVVSSFRIAQFIDVFEGDVTFESLVDATTIHLWGGSCLGSDCAVPRSGAYLIGATSGQALNFHRPVKSFGAWFTNTSGTDHAVATFFDDRGALLGASLVRIPVVGQGWRWSGWASSVPIARMELHGQGFREGFLWLDDLQIRFADPAGTTLRAGSGANPGGFTSRTDPILGTLWKSEIERSPAPGTLTLGTGLVLSLGGPVSGVFLPAGEVLVRPPFVLQLGDGEHALPIPADPTLSGATFGTQGFRIDRAPSSIPELVLLNGIDLSLGS